MKKYTFITFREGGFLWVLDFNGKQAYTGLPK